MQIPRAPPQNTKNERLGWENDEKNYTSYYLESNLKKRVRHFHFTPFEFVEQITAKQLCWLKY